MNNFFKNLKVVELASVLAGPSAGMFFAELGAQVLKIENKKTGGDPTRGWRLPEETSDGPSAYYASVNYRKDIIFLDLTDRQDHTHMYKMISEADLVISNYSASTARKLSVGPADLKKVKPDLIFVQLDGFRFEERVAYDVVLQAETGWISMTGTSVDAPAKLPVALIDITAGHLLKEMALLGIVHKMRTGEGSVWRCNLEQASLSALANQATNQLMNHHEARPLGTLHPNIAPYGEWFETLDGERLVLAVGTDAQFKRLCSLPALSRLAEEKGFAQNQDRVAHRLQLRNHIQDAFGKMAFDDLSNELEALHIPFGKVKGLREVMQSEAAQEMKRLEPMEGRVTERLSGNPFSFEPF